MWKQRTVFLLGHPAHAQQTKSTPATRKLHSSKHHTPSMLTPLMNGTLPTKWDLQNTKTQSVSIFFRQVTGRDVPDQFTPNTCMSTAPPAHILLKRFKSTLRPVLRKHRALLQVTSQRAQDPQRNKPPQPHSTRRSSLDAAAREADRICPLRGWAGPGPGPKLLHEDTHIRAQSVGVGRLTSATKIHSVVRQGRSHQSC